MGGGGLWYEGTEDEHIDFGWLTSRYEGDRLVGDFQFSSNWRCDIEENPLPVPESGGTLAILCGALGVIGGVRRAKL